MKKISVFTAFTIILLLICVLAMSVLQKKSPMNEPEKTQADQSLLNGQWSYMPGVTKTQNGLVVKSLQFALMEQNGVYGAANPPINVAGTHVENIKGDFSMTGIINLQDSTKAMIQLYGQTPIIADEFRLEKESLRLEFEKNKLTVSMWNGSQQTPFQKQNYFFTPKQPLNFKMTRTGGTLTFFNNDKQLGSINEYSIFKSGKMWVGLDSQGSDWLLSGFQILPMNGGTQAIKDSSNMQSIQITKHDPNGLQTKATKKRPGFLVGTTVALGPLTTDPQFVQVALDNHMFGSLTPENDMKMINLHPLPDVYSFQKADAIVKYAKQNGQKIHGHTLVFGEANPVWFNNLPVATPTDKQKVEKVMTDHITTVVKHFGKDIMSWDVVNEPLAAYDAMDQGIIMRNHKWYQAMGEDYIIKALKSAHQTNPDALLFINDYGLEEDGDRWNNMIALLQRLKPKLQAHGIPVNKVGVGFQAHVYETGDKINPAVLKRHIKQLQAMEYKAQISENDVYSDDGDAIQATQYRDIFNACLTEPNCIRWNAWIMSDRYDIWKDDDGQIYYGVDGLFGTDMKPRPAFTAMQAVLQ